jgi:hypothetical protein
MRKRTKALIVAAMLGAVVVIALVARDTEPRYQGHSLSYWLERYGRTNPDSPRGYEEGPDPKAVEAISRIGTNALPLLLSRLHCEPNPARQALASTLHRAPDPLRPGWLVNWAVSDPASSKAYEAALTFSVLGPAAKPAIPDLLKMMNDRKSTNTATLAQCALANIGEAALPYLVAVLRDTNAPNRRNAAFYIAALPRLRTNAAPAIPVLMHCLQDKDAEVQRMAAAALGQACLQPDLVVPALAGAYQAAGADPMLRRRCISALGGFAPRDAGAQACLLNALADPDIYVRRSATNFLSEAAPGLLTNAPAK